MHKCEQVFIWDIAKILNIPVFFDLVNNLPITEQPESCNNKNSYDCSDGGSCPSRFVTIIVYQFVCDFLPGDNFV